jgi:hypothetical protein
MAARLETSSKQYGVPLLFSQPFHELLSDDGRLHCRRLDVITVKGSEVPIGIYTYDVQQNQLFLKKKEPKQHHRGGTHKHNSDTNTNTGTGATSGGGGGGMTTKEIKSKKNLHEPKFLSIAHETSEVFEQDYDLITLRNHVKSEFLSLFQEGLELYLQGDWGTARGFFEKTTLMMKQIPFFEEGDGPSNTLLRYMEGHGWQAPSSWKGFRPLTSK